MRPASFCTAAMAISLNGTINTSAVITSIAAGRSAIGHSAATTRVAVTV